MAARAAQDIPDGSYVNLGIGIPELVTKFVPQGREFIYHSENGLLGMGPSPAPGAGDPELINAGKRQVTAVAGAVEPKSVARESINASFCRDAGPRRPAGQGTAKPIEGTGID